MIATERCQANAISADRDAGQHDRQAEPAPPRQRADQLRPGRDADGQADEDHREQDVEGRLAAAERAGRRTGRCRRPCRRRRTRPGCRAPGRGPAGSCRRRPSRRRTRGARPAGASRRSLRPLISLMPKKTTNAVASRVKREEVERERGRVEEALPGRRVTTPDSPVVRPASSSAAATGVMPYVVARVSWLAVSSRPRGSRFGTAASLAGSQTMVTASTRKVAIAVQAMTCGAAVGDQRGQPGSRRTGRTGSGRRRPSCSRRSNRSASTPAIGPSSSAGSSRTAITPPNATPFAVAPLTCVGGEDRRWRAGRASHRARRRRARSRAGGTAGSAGCRAARPGPTGRRWAAAARSVSDIGPARRRGRRRPQTSRSGDRSDDLRRRPAARPSASIIARGRNHRSRGSARDGRREPAVPRPTVVRHWIMPALPSGPAAQHCVRVGAQLQRHRRWASSPNLTRPYSTPHQQFDANTFRIWCRGVTVQACRSTVTRTRVPQRAPIDATTRRVRPDRRPPTRCPAATVRHGHRCPRPAVRGRRRRRLRRQRRRPGPPRRWQADPGRQQVGALPRAAPRSCWPGPAGTA